MRLELDKEDMEKIFIRKVGRGYLISTAIPTKLIGDTAIAESLLELIKDELSEYDLTQEQIKVVYNKLINLLDKE